MVTRRSGEWLGCSRDRHHDASLETSRPHLIANEVTGTDRPWQGLILPVNACNRAAVSSGLIFAAGSAF